MAGRIILLEPSLTGAEGHFAVTAERLRRLLAPTPLLVVPGPQTATGPWRRANTPPRFTHSRTTIARKRHYGPIVERLIRHGEGYIPEALRPPAAPPAAGATARIAHGDAATMRSLMLADIVRILKAVAADAGDLLLLPSADAEMILAIAEVHKRAAAGPQIALRLMYDDVGSHVSAPTWRSALAVLLAADGARQRLCLFAETLGFAAAIGEAFAIEVTLLPHPSPLTAVPVPPIDGEFVVFVPGKLRADKGASLINAIGQHLNDALRGSTLPAVTLRAQAVAAVTSDKLRCQPLPAFLPAAEYARQWHSCHAALLLNDLATFQLRGSGTVCDAVAAQRPFLALNGSTLSEWIIADNGVVAAPDAHSISDGIVSLIGNYHRHRQGTAAAAQRLAADLATAIDRLRGLLPRHH